MTSWFERTVIWNLINGLPNGPSLAPPRWACQNRSSEDHQTKPNQSTSFRGIIMVMDAHIPSYYFSKHIQPSHEHPTYSNISPSGTPRPRDWPSLTTQSSLFILSHYLPTYHHLHLALRIIHTDHQFHSPTTRRRATKKKKLLVLLTMAEIAATALVAEQVVSTGLEAGAAVSIAKPTQPLQATLSQIATTTANDSS